MPREQRNMLDYIVVCISEFADRYGMNTKEAYKYLHEFRGIAFLREFYDIEHTLSFNDVIDDLTTICKRNGGVIA